MNDPLPLIEARDAARQVEDGRAVLVDIRDADEFARIYIAGAHSVPLARLTAQPLDIEGGKRAIFLCRSGNRTEINRARLAASFDGEAAILQGGIEAWEKAGLAVEKNARAPLEMIRQVQIAAGALILAGLVLGATIAPAYYVISAFVGMGLMFAGVTGYCGMAKLLAAMPWNRRAVV